MAESSIIRSGWWVALAAGVLTIVVAAVMIAPLIDRPSSPTRGAEFDLADVRVPRNLIVRAMNRDGVMVLTAPAMLDAAEVDRLNSEERGKMLVSDDRVVGVEIAGDARAYPLRLLRWHEVVNEVVGGEAIAVTYSPLCDSVAVFSRELNGGEIELGVSGLLYNSNTLLYDRRLGPASSDLWIQLTGHSITPSKDGGRSRLKLRPASLTTWAAWRDRHPATSVLAPLPEMKKPYKRDPFNSYFGSDLLKFPVAPLPPSGGLHLKDRVVIATIGGADAVFALPYLAEAAGAPAGTVDVTFEGVPLRIRFDAVLETADVETLDPSDRLEAVRWACWFCWFSLEGTIPVIIRDAT